MRLGLGIICIVLALISGLVRQQVHAGESREFDVALILAVDVSASVDEGEAGIQRQGYISALRDPRMAEAVRGGLNGRIAISYVEWSSPTDQRILVPWREISSAADAASIADELEKAPYRPGSTTSISAALEFCARHIQASGIKAMRRVIDMSGDGYSDQGGDLKTARDAVVKDGIIINGLPVMNERAAFRSKIPADLDQYYAKNVTGGRGAFTLVVKKLEDFNKLVLQKLILEIAALEPTEKAS
jgi:Protein of unknown function (DUF1194)